MASRWVNLVQRYGRDTDVAVQDWIVVTAFTNSWVNYSTATHASASYFKDPFGIVHITGIIKDGTIGLAAFTLPVGYRPGLQVHFPAYSNAAFGGILVNASGQVIPQVGSNVWFSLDGTTFRPAA